MLLYFDWLNNIIISIITGVLASGIVAYVLLFTQYKKSISKHRLDKISQATRKIIELATKGEYAGYLRNRYRYSLGVILDMCAASYGIKPDQKKENLYPGLIPGPDEKGNIKDGWHIFNLYIRPVIEDINQFSHLVLIKIFCLRKLAILQELLIILENIVEDLDALRLYEINNNIQIIEYEGNHIRLNETSREVPELNILTGHYDDLEKVWYKWVKKEF